MANPKSSSTGDRLGLALGKAAVLQGFERDRGGGLRRYRKEGLAMMFVIVAVRAAHSRSPFAAVGQTELWGTRMAPAGIPRCEMVLKVERIPDENQDAGIPAAMPGTPLIPQPFSGTENMSTSIVSALNAADPGSDPVSLLMLRKTLDLQAQSVASLVQTAAAAAPVASNPPHLGQNVDVKV